jgi:hypothetical protein
VSKQYLSEKRKITASNFMPVTRAVYPQLYWVASVKVAKYGNVKCESAVQSKVLRNKIKNILNTYTHDYLV